MVLGEISDVIGGRRMRAMEPKVREKIRPGATGRDWIEAIAEVIVENSDTQADKGFTRGMAKVRALAASRSGMLRG